MSDSAPETGSDRRTPDGRSTTDSDEAGSNPREEGKWISVAVAVLGLWLIVETVWTDPAALFWNDVVTAILLVGLGGYNYSRRTDKRVGSIGVATVTVLLGLWLVISPFALSPAVDAPEIGFWNNVLIGAVTVVLGVYSAYEANKEHPDLRRMENTRT